MQAGDIVTIFTQPVTNEEREGSAVLIKPIQTNAPVLEFWKVKFLSGISAGIEKKRLIRKKREDIPSNWRRIINLMVCENGKWKY